MPILFFVNCERTVLFSVRLDLDPTPLPPSNYKANYIGLRDESLEQKNNLSSYHKHFDPESYYGKNKNRRNAIFPVRGGLYTLRTSSLTIA